MTMVIALGKKIAKVVAKPKRRRQNSILSTIISYLRIYINIIYKFQENITVYVSVITLNCLVPGIV